METTARSEDSVHYWIGCLMSTIRLGIRRGNIKKIDVEAFFSMVEGHNPSYKSIVEFKQEIEALLNTKTHQDET